MAIKDLNGDGYPDVFVLSGDYKHNVYFNNKNNLLQPSEQNIMGEGGQSVLLEDFDSDGDIDAWVGECKRLNSGYPNANKNQLYLNDGEGIFRKSNQNLTATCAERSSAGDIDLDGDIDIVMHTHMKEHNEVFVYKNNGKGDFTENKLADLRADGIALADYNKDGLLDLWVNVQSRLSINDGEIRVFLNDGSGAFVTEVELSFQGSIFDSVNLKVADIDNDGFLDARTHGQSTAVGKKYIYRGNNTFEALESSFFLARSGILVDVNADGFLDDWFMNPSRKLSYIRLTGPSGAVER